jgi:hypothetical protein
MWQLKTARILRDQSLRRNGDRPADHGKNFRHYVSGVACVACQLDAFVCIALESTIGLLGWSAGL